MYWFLMAQINMLLTDPSSFRLRALSVLSNYLKMGAARLCVSVMAVICNCVDLVGIIDSGLMLIGKANRISKNVL